MQKLSAGTWRHSQNGLQDSPKVDLKLAELEGSQYDIELFGTNDNAETARSRATCFLPHMCLGLERLD